MPDNDDTKSTKMASDRTVEGILLPETFVPSNNEVIVGRGRKVHMHGGETVF
jgi:hypothetical protein